MAFLVNFRSVNVNCPRSDLAGNVAPGLEKVGQSARIIRGVSEMRQNQLQIYLRGDGGKVQVHI